MDLKLPAISSWPRPGASSRWAPLTQFEFMHAREFDRALEYEVDLNEADGHRGLAMIIEISGNKASL